MKRHIVASVALLALAAQRASSQTDPKVDLERSMFETTSKIACVDSLPFAGEFARFQVASILQPINALRPKNTVEASVARLDAAYRDFERSRGCSQWIDLQIEKQRVELAARRDSLERAATIVGIAGVKWGATVAEIRRALGAPELVTVKKDALLTELQFSDRDLVGHSAGLQLTVHERYGLVSGVYAIPLQAADDCARLFAELKASVQSRYPTLQTLADRNENSSTALGQCDAITIGRGRLATVWKDSAGNEIAVLVAGRFAGLQSRGPRASTADDYLKFISARKAF